MKNRVKKLYLSLSEAPKRKEVQTIEIDAHGVIDDKFYNKELNRSILVTSIKAYKIAEENGIDISYGDLGENILIDADIDDLKPYDKFEIGDTTVEVTQNCTLCNGLTTINSKLPKLLKDDRGIFVKTIISGTIHVSDSIGF